MKKIYIGILSLLSLNAFSQVTPDMKSQIDSVLNSRNYTPEQRQLIESRLNEMAKTQFPSNSNSNALVEKNINKEEMNNEMEKMMQNKAGLNKSENVKNINQSADFIDELYENDDVLYIPKGVQLVNKYTINFYENYKK